MARLAATGRNSREVAAELFLSPRTIDSHLHSFYPQTRHQLPPPAA
ncbi:LuxR C-terminal-related transcriptional regulator [Nonomuraea lactucae]